MRRLAPLSNGTGAVVDAAVVEVTGADPVAVADGVVTLPTGKGGMMVAEVVTGMGAIIVGAVTGVVLGVVLGVVTGVVDEVEVVDGVEVDDDVELEEVVEVVELGPADPVAPL